MRAPAEHTPERLLDQYLVVMAQAGSSEALDGLARRWTPRLLRYAARVLGSSADGPESARDVVQETWVGAIRGLRRLRDPAQFPAWIYGIATRKCTDTVRSNIRRRELRVRTASANVAERPLQNAAEDDRMDLAAGIRALPPEQRSVVHLFYREELTIDEIAVALAVPAGTVKSRLHHARAVLKRFIETSPPSGSSPDDAAKGATHHE